MTRLMTSAELEGEIGALADLPRSDRRTPPLSGGIHLSKLSDFPGPAQYPMHEYLIFAQLLTPRAYSELTES